MAHSQHRLCSWVLGRTCQTKVGILSVDPIEGGCANAYVYVRGDPVNSGDLTGDMACSRYMKFGQKGGSILASVYINADGFLTLAFSVDPTQGPDAVIEGGGAGDWRVTLGGNIVVTTYHPTGTRKTLNYTVTLGPGSTGWYGGNKTETLSISYTYAWTYATEPGAGGETTAGDDPQTTLTASCTFHY